MMPMPLTDRISRPRCIGTPAFIPKNDKTCFFCWLCSRSLHDPCIYGYQAEALRR